MVFSEGEAQQLIEILTEKAGIVQDTWHTVGLPAPSWPPAAGALLSLGRCGGEGRWHVFRQAGPEGQSRRMELNFPLEQRAGSCACGVMGMGPEVVVPIDVLPRWQATQKGDPVAVLKRQLEEKEKQLTAEQEDAAAARNKLRELSKVSTERPSRRSRRGLCSSWSHWCASRSLHLIPLGGEAQGLSGSFTHLLFSPQTGEKIPA